MSVREKIKIVGDVGSERAVLSGLCQFGKQGLLEVTDIITIDTFTLEGNKALYKCLLSSFEEIDKIDITSVIAKAEELSLTSLVCKEKIDIEYLRSLFAFPILLENIRPHATRIAKLEIVRKAQQKHSESFKALSEMTGSESIDEILRVSEQPIFDLINEVSHTRKNNTELLSSGLREYIKNLADNPCDNIGLPTPFPVFNSVIGGGLRPGYVDLVVTRPKGRKSTFAINCGLHLSDLNVKVLYLDTEMDEKAQQTRCLSNLTGIDINLIETGKFSTDSKLVSKIENGMTHLERLPFYHESVRGLKFEEILSVIRRWVLKEVGLGKIENTLIIYDYFKLMQADILKEMQETQALGFNISALTDFCKDYNLSCLSFTQLNRLGIDQDTSDIIAQSDRFLWLCASASFLRKKTSEEIMQDGPENGNFKLKTIACRFGSGLDDNNHINFEITGNLFKIKEVNTHYDVKRKNLNSNEKTQEIDF